MKNINIIDIHTHTFPASIAKKAMDTVNQGPHIMPFTDGTNDGLRRSMEEAGVDMSVLLPVATNEKQPYKLNETAVRVNEKTEETGLLSFGAMFPGDPNWKQELKHIADLEIKGIKLHPSYQRVRFDSLDYMRIVGGAAELGLVVIVHGGKEPAFREYPMCAPEHVVRVLKETQADKLVIAHMGGDWMWKEAHDALCGLPLYFDTAFSFGSMTPLPEYPRDDEELKLCRTEYLLNYIREHGTDKVMFGSDSPWSGQKHELELLRTCGLNEEELKAILGENAKKLLGL